MTFYRSSTCRGCGKPVIWVRVTCSKCEGRAAGCTKCRARGEVLVPLDAIAPVFAIETDPEDGTGHDPDAPAPFARNLSVVDGPARRAFVSHFTTCPKREEFSSSKRRSPT